MPTRFRAHSHPRSLRREFPVELLGLLAVLKTTFLQFPSFCIHKCNLLERRVIIRSYNDDCSAPFSRALVGLHHQSLPGGGSRPCYGINYTDYILRPWRVWVAYTGHVR